jgi:hypothetical protein
MSGEWRHRSSRASVARLPAGNALVPMWYFQLNKPRQRCHETAGSGNDSDFMPRFIRNGVLFGLFYIPRRLAGIVTGLVLVLT